jgi:hypothetical protein
MYLVFNGVKISLDKNSTVQAWQAQPPRSIDRVGYRDYLNIRNPRISNVKKTS